MVIVSGIVDLADELFLRLVRGMSLEALGAAAERGDRTLAHFVGVERGDDGQAAARFSARCCGSASGRAPDAPGRAPRRTVTRRFFLVGLEHSGAGVDRGRRRRRSRRRRPRPSPSRPRRRRSASWLPARPCAWLPRRGGGALPLRACALRRPRARPARCLRGSARRRASSSAILRSSASRTWASASACARALRSSSVSVRSTTPDGFERGAAAGAAGAGPGAARPCGRGAAFGRRPASAALRLDRLRLARTDGAALHLLDHDLLGAAVAEALAHHARLDARGFSVKVLVGRPLRSFRRCSSYQSFTILVLGVYGPRRARRPLSAAAVVAEPVKAAASAPGTVSLAGPGEQRSMYHI